MKSIVWSKVCALKRLSWNLRELVRTVTVQGLAMVGACPKFTRSLAGVLSFWSLLLTCDFWWDILSIPPRANVALFVKSVMDIPNLLHRLFLSSSPQLLTASVVGNRQQGDIPFVVYLQRFIVSLREWSGFSDSCPAHWGWGVCGIVGFTSLLNGGYCSGCIDPATSFVGPRTK